MMNKMYVLDHGYVELLRVDGDDEFLAQTARTSTQSTGDPQKDARLVTRLVRDRHTSPIEFGGVVLELKMPIFVARQWMRHRTGAFNEFSMRYSEAPEEFYVPDAERCQAQSTFNKQGSAEHLGDAASDLIMERIRLASIKAYEDYQHLLRLGLTRELARCVLPVNFYTKVRWKIDLHNLMHFIKLREDPHAQYEIRVYAEVIHKMLNVLFPAAMKAFEDHVQNKIEVSPELARTLANYAGIVAQDRGVSLNSEIQEFMKRNQQW
jgi:thymidylate synthase (FAD)